MKIINPRRKSSYGVCKLKTTAHFSIVDDLKHQLVASLESEVTVAGYISPGHGIKGNQNPLEVDDDLVEMYTEYQSKREILLWYFATIEKTLWMFLKHRNQGNMIEILAVILAQWNPNHFKTCSL